jgi:ATP-dependent DNA helicase RecQ
MAIENVETVLRKFWGYDSFRPLQREAIECVLAGRDAIVVLPTGGGKSLCFQAPALVLPGLTVVVSPLISLMKDQVDGLVESGVPAARLDSSQPLNEQDAVLNGIRRGMLKIVYLAPERLITDRFLDVLRWTDLSMIAVDEAHCVSMWGHDFRPEYRQLGRLRELFPTVPIHAYTATATERVRRDIAEQLALRDPEVLVGSFDRPNLVYRAIRRSNLLGQVRAILDRHAGRSGILYCIRRADVDDLCAQLAAKGYRAAPYHAGMDAPSRKASQEAFIRDEVDVIVATVAFGMGIDKSDVRYVIHTGMPKSLEYYQQETGRAGRDGLEADCVLLFSGGDYGVWRNIIEQMEPEGRGIALAKLGEMYQYCNGVACRHRMIVTYFGQSVDSENCGACDVCLGDMDCHEDSLATAQKILSCVKRLGERFGADYTAGVLIGSADQRVLDYGHDRLSTYGLLAAFPRRIVRDWIEQLVAQGYLEKGDFEVLFVTDAGWRVLRGQESPRLLRPAKKKEREKEKRERKVVAEHAVGEARQALGEIDSGLFEALRKLRRQIAIEKSVPAYIVFTDAALRDMARRRPTTREAFLEVSGVGEAKCDHYGELFTAAIREYCGQS